MWGMVVKEIFVNKEGISTAEESQTRDAEGRGGTAVTDETKTLQKPL
jgi:hypothetical protein